LQLEVEAAAEALSERETPGLVETRAVRRMHDEMAVARLVEEALEHDPLGRRQRAERRLRGREIVDELRRGIGRKADAALERARRLLGALGLERDVDPGAQRGHGRGQLVAAAGRLAEPERDARRLAVRVLDVHLARLDLADPIRRVA